jgi:hypothetical protein
VVACVDVDGYHVAVLTGRRNRLDLVGADQGLRVGLQNGPGDAENTIFSVSVPRSGTTWPLASPTSSLTHSKW